MIGTFIKQYRIEHGMTQGELAEMLSIAQNTVSQYEKGKRAPTVKKLAHISKVLGSPVAALLSSDCEVAGSATTT